MEELSASPPGARRSRSKARHSLRVRVFLVVTLASLLPLLLVFLWSQVERPVATRLWQRTFDASERAKALVAAAPSLPAAELAALARAQRVRVRVLDAAEAIALDADEDQPTDPLHPVEAFFFGASPGDARLADQELGPLATRAVTLAAHELGGFAGCQFLSSLVCEGASPVKDASGAAYVVHVQASSARAVRAVYALRYQLLRIMLLAVPLSVLLGLYAARRVSTPIEMLRRQALSKAMAASRNADLPEPSDEVGDLSAAFNALLAALEAKRSAHQAFAADLVHELKSPVATVRAIADALETGRAEPERLARLSRALRESSAKLDRLVTQFLELARAEAGLPGEPRTSVDLFALASGLTRSLADDARHEHKRFVVEHAGGVAEVRVVAQRVEALARELCENAASFTEEGGTILVRIENTLDWVTLEVRDEGPGIEPDDLPKVWDRFFTTRGQKRGTGLGLALVRAVCEAHGGRAEVRSELGKGASFSVTFPKNSLPLNWPPAAFFFRGCKRSGGSRASTGANAASGSRASAGANATSGSRASAGANAASGSRASAVRACSHEIHGDDDEVSPQVRLGFKGGEQASLHKEPPCRPSPLSLTSLAPAPRTTPPRA